MTLDEATLDALARRIAGYTDAPRVGYLTTDEVADMLRVTRDFVYDHKAELGAVKLGGGRSPLRFPVAAVEAFMEARQVGKPKAQVKGDRRRGRPHKVTDVELLWPEAA